MVETHSKNVSIQIDMTPNGEFISPPGAPIGNSVLKWTIVIAALAGAGVLAAIAFWLALTLIPIAIGAGLIGYGILRYRMWQAGRSGGFPPFR